MQSDIYRLVNRILVLFFVVFFCVFAVTCFRGTGACPSLVLYNTPCMLCGCTRDFFGVFKGELGLFFALGTIALSTIVLNKIFRDKDEKE